MSRRNDEMPIAGEFVTSQHDPVTWLGEPVFALVSNGKLWKDGARASDGDVVRCAAWADLPLKGLGERQARQKGDILPPAGGRDGHWEGER